YPMYSGRVERETQVLHRLFGVDEASGEEFLLATPEQLAPLQLMQVHSLFGRLLRKANGPALAREGLHDCLRRYEQGRRRGTHDGRPLRALRLYRVLFS